MASTGAYPGPDDHIWIANVGGDSIARLDPLAADPAATLEIHPPAPDGIHPRAWRPGPDGWMWFSHREPDRLQRIDTSADDWRQAIEIVCGPEPDQPPRRALRRRRRPALVRQTRAAPRSAASTPPRPTRPATLELFTAPGLQTPFDLQAVGDFMAFTDNGGRVGRIRALCAAADG